MNNEENGLTLRQIGAIIKKYVWVVLGVTVAFAIVFACLVQFWFNTDRRMYRYDFTLTTSALTSTSLHGGVAKYEPEALLSKEQLTKIKQEGGDAFASIDVDKLVDDAAITLTQSESGESDQVPLSVSAHPSYFDGKAQAEQFLAAVSQNAVTYLEELVQTAAFDGYLVDYRESKVHTYEQKLEFLTLQHEQLIDLYDALIEREGSYFVVSYTADDGTKVSETLSTYRSNCNAAFDLVIQEDLTEELLFCGYILDLDYYKLTANNRNEVLTALIAHIDAELAQFQAMLDESTSSAAEQEAIAVAMAPLYERKAAYRAEQENIAKNIALSAEENAERNSAFDGRLNDYANLLQEQADILRDVSTAYLLANSEVQSGAFSVAGGIHVVLAFIGGAIIGFCIVVIAVCIVELRKNKKQEASETESFLLYFLSCVWPCVSPCVPFRARSAAQSARRRMLRGRRRKCASACRVFPRSRKCRRSFARSRR